MNSEVREQCLYLSGDVSVQTLDAAALALMIAALRARGQSSLQWRNLPESVRLLAELYEIEEWISE